jgi:hypothetical protein
VCPRQEDNEKQKDFQTAARRTGGRQFLCCLWHCPWSSIGIMADRRRFKCWELQEQIKAELACISRFSRFHITTRFSSPGVFD